MMFACFMSIFFLTLNLHSICGQSASQTGQDIKTMNNLASIITSPWAITPDMLQEIGGVYAAHVRGEKINIASVEERIGHPLNNEKTDIEMINGVAVISAHGVVAKRMNMFMQISGGISTEILGSQIQTALDDPEAKAIVLDIDSPGGTVDGTFELAESIFNSRGEKPIVSIANGLMASAAYAIGAATDAIYMTGSTTHVGSIGVVAAHTDYSKYEEKLGVKTTEIYAGEYKRIASQYEPLSDAGRANIQESVDYLYSLFVDQVAKYRGVTVDTVLADMADGRLFIGQQAIDAGLVDGVKSLNDLIASLSSGTPSIIKQTHSTTTSENLTMADIHDDAAIERQARQEWERSPELQNEFVNRFETYLAFRKAELKGQVRITGRGTVSGRGHA